MNNYKWGLLVPVLLLLTGCPPRQFHGDDRLMMHAAMQVQQAIDNYHSELVEWPETLDEARPYHTPGEPWPTNPYNLKELADTGSKEFDPATSVGMVYYERVFRDDRQVSFQLHVFGDKDKLYIFGNYAVGSRE